MTTFIIYAMLLAPAALLFSPMLYATGCGVRALWQRCAAAGGRSGLDPQHGPAPTQPVAAPGPAHRHPALATNG